MELIRTLSTVELAKYLQSKRQRSMFMGLLEGRQIWNKCLLGDTSVQIAGADVGEIHMATHGGKETYYLIVSKMPGIPNFFFAHSLYRTRP